MSSKFFTEHALATLANICRVAAEHIAAMQVRFADGFAHASLTFDEARDLIRILTEAIEIPAQSSARS